MKTKDIFWLIFLVIGTSFGVWTIMDANKADDAARVNLAPASKPVATTAPGTQPGETIWEVSDRWGYERVVFRSNGQALKFVSIRDKISFWEITPNEIWAINPGWLKRAELDWATWEMRFRNWRVEAKTLPEKSSVVAREEFTQDDVLSQKMARWERQCRIARRNAAR